MVRRRDWRVTHQKLPTTKRNNKKPKTTKSLGARYAELLRLREAVSRSQSDLQLSSNVERPAPRGDRAFPYH
jgi:hypothetical protein